MHSCSSMGEVAVAGGACQMMLPPWISCTLAGTHIDAKSVHGWPVLHRSCV